MNSQKHHSTQTKKPNTGIRRWVLAVSLAVLLLWPIYTVSIEADDFAAWRHNDELYILVFKTYDGSFSPLLGRIQEILVGMERNKELRKDVIVYYLHRGTVRRYYSKNVGLGSPFVHLNKLYYLGGPADIILIWQWTERGFERVSDAQTHSLIDVFSKMKDKGETSPGWERFTRTRLSGTIPSSLPDKKTPILLGTTKYELIYRRTPIYATPGESLSLRGPGLSPAEQSLFSSKQNEQFVSWRTYQNIRAGR